MKSSLQQLLFIEFIISVKENQYRACRKCKDSTNRSNNSYSNGHVTDLDFPVLNQKSLAATHHNSYIHLKEWNEEYPLKENEKRIQELID